MPTRFHTIPYLVHTQTCTNWFISLHITQTLEEFESITFKNKGLVIEQLISIHLKTTDLPPLPKVLVKGHTTLKVQCLGKKENHHFMSVCGVFPFNVQRVVEE